MKAANGEAYEQELQIIKTSCYKDDLNFDQLEQQLPLSVNLVQQALPDVKKVTCVRTICEAMKTRSVYKSMLFEIHNLLRLYLTIPITSAISEVFFSFAEGFIHIYVYL